MKTETYYQWIAQPLGKKIAQENPKNMRKALFHTTSVDPLPDVVQRYWCITVLWAENLHPLGIVTDEMVSNKVGEKKKGKLRQYFKIKIKIKVKITS